MRPDMTRLRDQIVWLEMTDARQVRMDAARYLAAARLARQIVERELGGLAMRAFVSATLPTLQTVAENTYFDNHRCFADLDGGGAARRAQAVADRLLRGLGVAPAWRTDAQAPPGPAIAVAAQRTEDHR